MYRRFLCLAMAALIFTACEKDSTFGEAFVVDGAISVDELFSRLSANPLVSDLVVTGEVEDVCQVKGCWLTLNASDGTSMRVTFKDYGFFVPKNIGGRKVAMKGTGMASVTSVDDQRHYAADAGKSEEEINAITEPLEEFTFVATGVQLLD